MSSKKCKGINRAKDFQGCGEESNFRRYGLCPCCYKTWLLTTDEGQQVIEKQSLKAKKKVTKLKKRSDRIKKVKLMTKSEAEKKLQAIINKIVRELDNGKGCISCDHGWASNWTRQKHAGHYFSRGSNPQLRFDVNNIYLQCSICNNWKSGNEMAFTEGIKKHYGLEQWRKVEQLKATERDWSKQDVLDKTHVARDILKDLKSGRSYDRDTINELMDL